MKWLRQLRHEFEPSGVRIRHGSKHLRLELRANAAATTPSDQRAIHQVRASVKRAIPCLPTYPSANRNTDPRSSLSRLCLPGGRQFPRRIEKNSGASGGDVSQLLLLGLGGRQRALGTTAGASLPLPAAGRALISIVRGASLCRPLQISYQVCSVARIGQTGVWHPVARDDLLCIGDEFVDSLRGPSDATAFHGC
jgi:hypothetical protein